MLLSDAQDYIMHTTVMYHGHCPDGIAAAFACWQQFGDQAQYLPVSYGQPIPEIPPEHNVMIVDFSYPPDILRALAASRSVVLLDHHASAQRDLRALQAEDVPGLMIYFDLQESGASLTWKYFATQAHIPAPETPAAEMLEGDMPLFFHYVRDRDLWRWQLLDSKAISMAYRMILDPPDFERIQSFASDLSTDDGYTSIVRQGDALLGYATELTREQAARFTMATIGGHLVPVVNATCLYSEVGDWLCQQHPDTPFVAYYFDRNDGKRQWGMRSRGGFDCSIVAKAMGGGGHPGAAGFVTTQTWKGD